ncbi:hypothetical protein D3C86_1600360 [compost metagenome]
MCLENPFKFISPFKYPLMPFFVLIDKSRKLIFINSFIIFLLSISNEFIAFGNENSFSFNISIFSLVSISKYFKHKEINSRLVFSPQFLKCLNEL